MRTRILLLGPLPPPVDGRALATSWLARVLETAGFELIVVDTQTNRIWPPSRFAMGALRRFLRCLEGAVRIAWQSPESVVIVASGGLGLLGEAAPIVAARLRRRPVALMHHSSSYLRKRSGILAAIAALSGQRLTHVVLSDQMRTTMVERYGLPPGRVLVLNNAALMPTPQIPTVRRHARILHMANMRASKGSLVVLDVARRLGSTVDHPLMRLAGPADAEVLGAIREARLEGVGVDELGTVADDRKFAELAGCRIFLLPSSYPHEAQPLVVYEAAAAGVVPVVWSVGWVAEQMASLGLERFVFEPGDIDGTVRACADLLALSDEDFDLLAAQVAAAYQRVAAHTRGQPEELIARLRHPGSAPELQHGE